MMKSTIQNTYTSLKDYIPYNRRANILLFGQSGAGKSSTINTLDSDFQVVKRAEVRYENHGQCTVEYKGYKFSNFCTIFDTWGWIGKNEQETGNYSIKDFEKILRGSVEEGFSVKKDISKDGTGQRENSRMIDVVIFVLSAGDARDNTDAISNMRPFYKFAQDRKIPVFFAITKIDSFFLTLKKNLILYPNPKKALSDVICSKEWKDLQINIRKYIGDNDANSLPIINYDQYSHQYVPVTYHFAKEFCRTLTQIVDNHYRSLHLEETEEDGIGSGLMNNMNSQKIGEAFLFKKEVAVPLTFQRTIDQEVHKVETYIDGGPEEKIVLYQTYYKLLQIGVTKWRFFLISSKILGYCKLCGVYNPDFDIIFESLNVDKNIRMMKKSFNPEKSVQQYCFLNQNGVDPRENFDFNNSAYLRMTLYGGKVLRLRRVRRRSSFHNLLLSNIQEKKTREGMMNNAMKRIEDLRLKSEQDNQILKTEINRLNLIVGELVKAFQQQKQQYQQQMKNSQQNFGGK